MSILQDISTNLQIGKAKIVKTLVQQALDEGISAQDILSQGLLDGMNKVGEQFKNNEIFVPEVLIAARAMSMGTAVLKPYLASEGVQSRGKIVIGTVRGDLHDIGKNLVKMMIEGKGIEVIDLGTDVPAEKFVQTAIENQCQVICLSALLTTTMGVMADVVSEAEKAGIRDKVKIMIGGAPVTDAYCQQIHADAYTPDAASAADKVAEYCANAG
ncbi:MAG TPA: corrinoid protein [Candidatus Ornithocaccomicrobium faecavium]|uniref:Corrinoid protein n=1 Tax=Candidatus Ornithocaccomicrobium faecavium TaxID=2840890 RepID=A0A9D1TBT8_9FIRM|nr:corrinoid protein [Clostridiales bacterium]HIV27234.1 corrinoid protein [Candidatus Ornithocaccomicrobium faecavium]